MRNKNPNDTGQPSHADALLTVGEAAELLRVSVSCLNKWRVYGGGPRFVYVGRRVRYRPADIASYVTSSIRTSTSQTARAGVA